MKHLILIMMILGGQVAGAQGELTKEPAYKFYSNEMMNLHAEKIAKEVEVGEIYEMDYSELCEFVLGGEYSNDSVGPNNERCLK